MSFFRKLIENLNEDFVMSKDNLCTALQNLGIDAQIAPLGRKEEKITSRRGDSLGVIDIPIGPIRWITLKKKVVMLRGDPAIFWSIEYGIPDGRIKPGSPRVRIHTVRVKSVPLFGKVIDLRWKGRDFGLGVIERLGEDVMLKKPIMDTYDLGIEAYPRDGCWIIMVREETAPSRELWDSYNSIADHLLETPALPAA